MGLLTVWAKTTQRGNRLFVSNVIVEVRGVPHNWEPYTAEGFGTQPQVRWFEWL